MTGLFRRFGDPIRWLKGGAAAVAVAICSTAGLTVSAMVNAAEAAEEGIIGKGDALVSGFSGTKTDKDVPPDIHPLDRTFIDPDGAAVTLFDLSKLGTAPRGQLSNVAAKLKIKASETGQVYGVALDDAEAPNAYVTATSMFGLQIVKKGADGKFERLVNGEDGAEWMTGQFGPGTAGAPGAIYKIDGKTGAISLFATVKLNGVENAGPALGNITFDPRTRQLFVSDLETGMIHRLTLDGKERDVFDHGVAGRTAQGLEPVDYDPARRMDITKGSFNSEDPSTWGYADERRRVFGLAVNSGRLYYAVTEGPAVWSVAIDDEGDFGTDPRIELEIAGSAAAVSITDIVFDGRNKMYLSQRGPSAGSYDYTKFAEPQKAAVLRYTYDEQAGRWSAAADEYAIGLPKTYQGTQGGIALNYGYDKYGNINYGACRQTLWTTGEHLREGEDVQLVSSGGARIVHGLQGNYTKLVRPANEPPNKAWFTDYDDRYANAAAYGHIGDVAIYAPCDSIPAPKRVETAPYPPAVIEPPAPDYEPPFDEPGLIVEKHCFPGAIGGKIKCTILVKNLSGQIVSQDIKFTDATEILFGPAAGTLVPIVAAVPLHPGLTCAATPTPDFWCSMPAAILLPGEAIGVDVFIDTHDLAIAGNTGFMNCATLYHPDGHSMACDEGGTDIIVEKTGPAFCLPGGTCTFTLKIANIGTLPYNGDVLLADAMFVGGASVGAPVTAVNPPIACSAGNTAALPFTCVTTLSLLPGEEHVHTVDVTMPAPGGYWAHNCFGALDPALVPVGPVPPGLGLGGAGAGNPSCAWVHVPVPSPNLSLQKTALNGGKCDKPGANLICHYEIAVTNHDAAAFNGIVKVEDTLPAGASLVLATPPFGCAGGPPTYTCDTGVAVNIPAGSTLAFNVTVSIPPAASEANLCKVPNTAKITMPPGGAAPNLDPTDDTGAAEAWTFGIFWEDPITHITFVMCDPTNLKVAKTAKGDCEKSGDGFTCEYDVTVTNTGPDPYKGPVKLDEKFGLAPTGVAFTGDFNCNGAGANYSCETGVVELPKNGVLKLNVKATIPDTGTCEAPNTATMTFPPAGSKGNGKGDDDSASASASVPSERCEKQSSTPIPPVKRCPDGLPMPRSGKCPCPQGTVWSRSTNSCEGDEPEEPQGCTPGRNEVKLDNGRCVCRDGFIRNDGVCVRDEPDEPQGCTPGRNEVKLDNGRCVCREGFIRNDGVCVRDEPDEPEGCTPGRNEVKLDNGRCVCREGFIRDDGVCVRDEPDVPQGCTPGPNEVKTPNGRCVCRDGFDRDKNGRCVTGPSDQPQGCKPGENEVKLSNGRCVCRNGYHRDDGVCIKDQADEPQSCGRNEVRLDNGVCDCRQGFRRNAKGVCVRGSSETTPIDPATQCKLRGRIWTGGRCVEPNDPAQECRKSGGTWTGARCVYQPKECPKGYVGTPPNCKLRLPDPPKVPKQKCPFGTIGTWPNCSEVIKPCPPGTIGKRPNCKPIKLDPPKVKVPKIDIKPNKPPKVFVPNKQPKVIVPNKPIFKPQIDKPKLNFQPKAIQGFGQKQQLR